jgi:hypothetical protein
MTVTSSAKIGVYGNKGLWFDAEMYCGKQDIECVCDKCLKSGKLMEIDVSLNEVGYRRNYEFYKG